jgi:uracil-DNA glycosylase family 4
MPATGQGRLRVLILAEAPGANADGIQLVGRAGQLLRERLRSLDIDLDRDCWKMNAISCRPPGNRTPTPKEIDHCRPMVYEAIRRLKPRVIIPLGKTALESLVAHRWAKALDGISRWRGWAIPDREFGAWVVPSYHPSFILRGQEGDAADFQLLQDLALAFDLVNTPLPTWKAERDCIRVLKTIAEAADYLDKLIFDEPELCAFDYETTGLKPYGAHQRVVCASLSPSPDEAAVFLFPVDPGPEADELTRLWQKFLASPIGKVASNMKFEHVWSTCKFGVEPVNWQWDTMLAAHVLDNRPGITSIKFQGYVQTGLVGYEDQISPFLESTAKDEKARGGNAVNRIGEAPVEDLLYYCAMDSLLEHRVALLQMDQI